jgi:hypothetical protein
MDGAPSGDPSLAIMPGNEVQKRQLSESDVLPRGRSEWHQLMKGNMLWTMGNN